MFSGSRQRIYQHLLHHIMISGSVPKNEHSPCHSMLSEILTNDLSIFTTSQYSERTVFIIQDLSTFTTFQYAERACHQGLINIHYIRICWADPQPRIYKHLLGHSTLSWLQPWIYQHSLCHSILSGPATQDLSTFTTAQYTVPACDPWFINIHYGTVCWPPRIYQHSLCHCMLSRPATEDPSKFTTSQYAKRVCDRRFDD